MEPQQTPAATQTSRKVLIIEDEHFISELYLRALTRAGYEATVEVDGKKGLELAETDNYDIILLDLMLPTMTGIDILRHLRGPGAKPLKARIVITTNLEQREDIRADIERQADAYLVKAEMTPHELVDFLNTIK